jgi:N-glycosylase/DNA lyase
VGELPCALETTLPTSRFSRGGPTSAEKRKKKMKNLKKETVEDMLEKEFCRLEKLWEEIIEAQKEQTKYLQPYLDKILNQEDTLP